MRLSLLKAARAFALALAVAAAPQAQAAEDDAAFDARVRAYLLENPEVILEALEILETRRAEAEAAGDAALVAAQAEALFAAEGDLVMGDPEGDVAIVEFADYRCGYCKAAAPRMAQLLDEDGDIRLIVKEFPILGPESLAAARAAIAAGRVAPERYEAVHEALMGHRGQFDEAEIFRLVEQAGVAPDAVRAEMAAAEAAIDAQLQATYDVARALQIQGTPSFVIGDAVARGLPDLETLRAMVAEARGEAG